MSYFISRERYHNIPVGTRVHVVRRQYASDGVEVDFPVEYDGVITDHLIIGGDRLEGLEVRADDGFHSVSGDNCATEVYFA